jgi:oligopeptide/dipeptide ABC transporter ATP-binding protein
MDSPPILEVRNLSKRFNMEAGFFARFGQFVYAVNGVSFNLYRGETYGLVGESGCGKTTTARLLLGMYGATSGSILYRRPADNQGRDVCAMSKKELKAYREKVKYIFQDPAKSLNPRHRVRDILLSGRRWSPSWPGKNAALEEAAAILEETGLSASDLNRRPQDFSGGQRQRISIARALLMKPGILVCDEVVSALDVSIQGQILNLLLDLREKRGLSALFITHDLKIACYFCDRIGVMYRGEIMEESPAGDFYRTARHPYTRLLFDSVTAGDSNRSGEVQTPYAEITGCPFAPRCPQADGRCRTEHPELAGETHRVRCFHP